MITVISRFRVRNGLEEEVRRAFVDRPGLVEKAAGFCGLNVLTDATDPAVFLLLTRWRDTESFQAWHRSKLHHKSHKWIPHGLKLDPSFTSLTIGNHIEGPSRIQSLRDVFESQPVALSQWLMESDGVFALLLAPDGAIRARNRASDRVFPPDPTKNFGSSIWDYLVCSDAQHLRERLSATAGPDDGSMLLNLTDGKQNPITQEVGLIRCDKATLLLGTPEHRHDSNFQTEILKLTNDLSVMVRESARKNRELKAANETIERLARTDALTGLANRRTLDEAFRREIARAERQADNLSVIMADLDHFKSINDEYGHITGDQVLAAAAAVFGSQLRLYDLAARYGGEEFVLLRPGTSSDEAMIIAERVRKEVEKIRIPACPRQITISLGVASCVGGDSAEALVARADTALYEAKTTGRNRVVAAARARA